MGGIFSKLINALTRKEEVKEKETGEIKQPKQKRKEPAWQKNFNVKSKVSNYKKGKDYEKYIGELYEKEGYIVKFNGIEKGKKDSSIDLIAVKGNEIVLIQCKNWKENSRYKITHKEIKAFIGDSHLFLEKNPQYKNYDIKRVFVVSNKILDKSAIEYIKENKDKIRYRLVPFKNNN